MAYVVGQGGKKMVLSSAAKKWKDFNSTLIWQFIIPFTNDKEKDAFIASRLSPKFEVVHSEQSQRKEKCEYNHRLSRKGYVGLEDELKETMPGEEIDCSLLWKKAREDKQGNIPDSKDDLKKQVSDGTLTVTGSNNILTSALGTLEHGGRVRGVGAGVSPSQFFNLPRHQRVKFVDKLKESVMEAVREETMRIEARAKESVLEAVKEDREIMWKQFSQLIPNFDPNMLKTPITPIPLLRQEQSPKNLMSDKASCLRATNVRPLVLEEENAKNMMVMLLKNSKMKRFLKARLATSSVSPVPICPDQVSFEQDQDILQLASMVEIGSTVIAVYMRGHWVLIIVRLAKETVYYMDSLPNRSVNKDMRNIVNTQTIIV
ncbi:unnamed protein product [Prunus armeniaca]